MPNPIVAWLKGDHLPRRQPVQTTTQSVEQQKLYFYPDFLNPSIATQPDINAAIKLGTLVHGPGASEMIYQAWHHDDSNSAVFACLSAICTAFPEAPLKVWRETSTGERDHQPDHPLQALLDKPNPNIAREHFWHYVTWCKHVNGNAYVRKIRSGQGNIVALWPISPMRIVPVTTKEDALKGIFISWYAYTYDPSKEPELIPPEDIIHFRLGLDDRDLRLGQAPLARLVQEVAGDAEAHKWQTQMLSNGGTVGMLITVPSDSSLTVEQAETMKSDFEQRFGGQNRGRTGVLMGGAAANPYGFSPDQMDMKSLHRIPEERIAAVLRVPAIIAGLGAGLDRSTYANFREAREMFAEMTLLPLFGFDAATMNMQLVPEFTSDPNISVAFDVTDLRAFQEDEDAKWKRLDLAVKTGWVRPNEARSDVGLPPDLDEDALMNTGQPGLPGGQQRTEVTEVDGQKARRAVNVGELDALPEVLQALVELGEPGTEQELEGYLNRQRRTVKRRLVAGG
jgi:HK97 family phage portal protein